MANSPVYIAGVGISHLNKDTSKAAIHSLAVSAGTKALLDAGVTYNDVNHSVACFLDNNLKVAKSTFDTYGKAGASISEVDCHSGLFVASQSVRSGHADCAMLIGFDKEPETKNNKIVAVSVVLVSQAFLTSHAYLKDSSISISASSLVGSIHSRSSGATNEARATKIAIKTALHRAALSPEDIQIVDLKHSSDQNVQQVLGELHVSEDGHASPISKPVNGSTGLAGLCELVWQLRGWAHDRAISQAKNCLQYTTGPDGTVYVNIFGRADGRPAPEWKVIEHVRDGRERLGNNPAIETKDISLEDWEAVKSRDEFVPKDTGKALGLPVKGGDRAALARL